jgi:hypothetical protein
MAVIKTATPPNGGGSGPNKIERGDFIISIVF